MGVVSRIMLRKVAKKPPVRRKRSESAVCPGQRGSLRRGVVTCLKLKLSRPSFSRSCCSTDLSQVTSMESSHDVGLFSSTAEVIFRPLRAKSRAIIAPRFCARRRENRPLTLQKATIVRSSGISNPLTSTRIVCFVQEYSPFPVK